jgi:hypothetical protein
MINPFSTRFVKPGALHFHFQPGDSLSSVLEILRQTNWVGEIVGPHGSGKSTLVSEISSCFPQEKQMAQFLVRTGDRQWKCFSQIRKWIGEQSSGSLLIVDGMEQLNCFFRWMIIRGCRQKRLGFLATAHRSIGLPTIITTTTSVDVFRRLVSQLISESSICFSADTIVEVFLRHQPNIREALFEMYDLAETKLRNA